MLDYYSTNNRLQPKQLFAIALVLQNIHYNQTMQQMGQHRTIVMLPDPAALGSMPGNSEYFSDMIFREKIVNVTEVNRRLCCLEQWTAEA